MKMIRIFFGFLGLLGFLGFLALFSSNASAQFTSPAFWKHSTPYLTFTNTTSTINARICSSSTTVQSTSSGGVPLNVGSLLTVNLSTTDAGMSFYSDPLCLTPITSITISAGTSTTASFYFMTTSLGLSSITASATGYRPNTQTKSSTAYPYTWIGGGANANWTTAANWLGGSAPGVSNYALFDGTCLSNCSPDINSSISILGLKMNSDYTGTITQNAGMNITLATGGWLQMNGTFIGSSGTITVGAAGNASNNGYVLFGGTFTGGSGAITINTHNYIGVSFRLENGNFTSTSGTLTISEVWLPGSVSNLYLIKIASGVTFNHNNGTVKFSGRSAAGNGGQLFLLDVGTNLTLYNATLDGDGGYGSGHSIVSGQTINVLNTFDHLGGGILAVPGADSTLVGQWHLYGVSNFFGGGNQYSYGNNGTVVFKRVGNQTYTCTQTLAYPSGYPGPFIYVNKPSGDLTTSSTNCLFAGLNLQQGSFSAPSGTLQLGFSTGSANAISGSWNILNVAAGTTFNANNGTVSFVGRDSRWGNHTFFITVPNSFSLYNVRTETTNGQCCGGSLTVSTGSILATNSFNWIGGSLNGTWEAQGTVTLNSTSNGTANFIFSGTQNPQIINGSALLSTGNITVNHSAGGIQLAGAFSANNTGQSFDVSSGTVDMNGFSLTVKALTLNGNTLQKNGGALTVNGSTAGTGSLFGGTVNP